jgi:phenylpropionate dioxygenase-like ring-hydroxylating dioxygenase large terminal subunit
MWMKNTWQVAGFASEIKHEILARRFCNEPVILWRTQAGEAVAMEDRCPHRRAPLSIATLHGDEVRCGYHGMGFNKDGKCVHVPGQDSAPGNALVRTYPLVERYRLIWIWLGDASLADPALVPDLHWMDHEGWVSSDGYHQMKANYRLVTDNLLDLSHETYVHKETIGNGAVADAPVQVKLDRGRIIRAHREMPNIDPPPFFAHCLNYTGKINRWQIAIYMPPGMHMTEAAVHPVGTPREKAFLMRALHLLTPETDDTTHYFWGVCRNFRIDEPELTASIYKGVRHTFDEDKFVLELQAARLREDGDPPVPMATIKVDAAPIQGRRLLASLVEKEKQDPTFVAPPLLMADDAVVSRPPVAA